MNLGKIIISEKILNPVVQEVESDPVPFLVCGRGLAIIQELEKTMR